MPLFHIQGTVTTHWQTQVVADDRQQALHRVDADECSISYDTDYDSSVVTSVKEITS